MNVTINKSCIKNSLLATLLASLCAVADAAGEAITVYKDPECGCCVGWVAHLRESGYQVRAIDAGDMVTIKKRLGVPQAMASCHTAVVDATGQVIEGHVPAAAVAKLIAKPAAKGVAVPGMPMNSPGMGRMDGNLVTVVFSGQPFSRD